ncbi:hypothetical protein C9F11_28125 [Streptomyces sp. YIM 121038]|uniref:DUF397 domain-containing protein n=1 Tax=Streptomyces sp. YIM 121038 TaxID=2136401 RepID=UPI0011108410|nr:DUF397 domain-containing protein [Streptomyces sp. YIM 121038]QCX79225.1 hypothetical protein C9F11_28125 [Streptomyces sp. YIM 121038]
MQPVPRRLTATELAPDYAWFKSSYSDGTGQNCIEVADLAGQVGGGVGIRDSKDPEGPALVLGRPAWAAFVAGVVQDGGSQR